MEINKISKIFQSQSLDNKVLTSQQNRSLAPVLRMDNRPPRRNKEQILGLYWQTSLSIWWRKGNLGYKPTLHRHSKQLHTEIAFLYSIDNGIFDFYIFFYFCWAEHLFSGLIWIILSKLQQDVAFLVKCCIRRIRIKTEEFRLYLDIFRSFYIAGILQTFHISPSSGQDFIVLCVGKF